MSDRNQSYPVLEIKEVSLATSMNSNYLLQDISFAVTRGDRSCIIGPSGSGKTSLLRLLNRLIEPTSGVIKFNNHSVNNIPVIQLRQRVVLVPQEPKLLSMTVEEALAYPLRLQKLSNKEIQQRVETWRSKLHIPGDWLDRNELQLSLGQRQLVAIARALVMQPQILLLDEPTSALDTGLANHLIRVLTQLVDEDQTTILLVTHQLDLAQKFAQRVLYLQQGQLLEDISAEQLDWLVLRDKLVQAQAQRILNSEF